MKSCTKSFWLVAGLLALAPVLAAAQWSSDPAIDLSLADGPTEQCVPHMAPTSDGGCYVGWYDNLSLGVFHVRLQRLSPAGVELWGHDGILVSDHPTDTWVMDWDLITDSQGNALLAFNDLRNGEGEFDVQIYKIDPDGNFLWGPDGISLTNSRLTPGFPRLAEAADGDIVAVWPEGNMAAEIKMQRLSPAGEIRFIDGGTKISEGPGKFTFGAKVIPTPDNGVMVGWIPDSDLSRDRHLSVQKIAADGSNVWHQPVKVFDDGNIPIGTYFELLPDGQGGAVLTWAFEADLYFTVMAQHLTDTGMEMWPHNGLVVFQDSPSQHLYPSLAYDSTTNETYIFSRSQTLDQRRWGLDGQKLAADGTRLWGESGRELLTVDYTWVSIPLCALVPAEGAMVFYLTHDPNCTGQERINAMRIDAAGKFAWPQETVVMASTLSDKLYMSAYLGSDGAARTVWQDRRLDYGDILAKCINLDGSLGLDALPTLKLAKTAAGGGVGLDISPNPFNPQTVISFNLERAQKVAVNVCDLRGRRLAQLADQYFGEGVNKIVWTGIDASGRSLASGAYVVQVLGEDFTSLQKVTLVR